MAERDTVALRKRAQIAKANRMMFMWVAIASVVVSASVVVLYMLFQKFQHNQEAIGELNTTVKNLRANNDAVPELQNQIRMLGSNPALLDLRTSDSDNALRVILDALPAEPNPSALGASLQTKLFDKISVESIQVTPIIGGETAPVDSSTTTATTATTDEPDLAGVAEAISFQFVVKGSPNQLKQLLTRLERSIRTIQVASLRIEGSGNSQTLSVTGEAYYLPAKTLQLVNKDIENS